MTRVSTFCGVWKAALNKYFLPPPENQLLSNICQRDGRTQEDLGGWVAGMPFRITFHPLFQSKLYGSFICEMRGDGVPRLLNWRKEVYKHGGKGYISGLFWKSSCSSPNGPTSWKRQIRANDDWYALCSPDVALAKWRTQICGRIWTGRN